MADAGFILAADAMDGWRDSVLRGEAPELWPAGVGALARIELGPGQVVLLGGAPGVGKTALAMQLTFDALRATPDLRALVCNVEMPLDALLDRQLSRLSGIDASAVRHRRLTAQHAERLQAGFATLERVASRLAFLRPPFDFRNVADAIDRTGTRLVLLDYLQRFGVPDAGGDPRERVNKAMELCRRIADHGICVLAVSALGRTRDAKGRSSYAGEGLGLASFRESAELEYGADSAFLLLPSEGDPTGERVTLKHLKARHGETRDLALLFDRPRQAFADAEQESASERRAKLSQAIRAAWSEAGGAAE